MPVVAYDVRGLTVITWAEAKRMTWTFLDAYCDEAYAVLSADWINDLTAVAAKPSPSPLPSWRVRSWRTNSG